MNAQTIIQKVKQYPIAVGFGAVALVLLVAVVMRFGRIGELEAQVADLDAKRGKMQRNARFGATLEADNAELKRLLGEIGDKLVDPNTKATNLDYFYSLQERTGLHVSRVKQEDPPPVDPRAPKGPVKNYEPLKFYINGEGSFSDLVRFLDLVQRDRYLVRLERLRFAPAQETLEHSINAEIDLRLLAAAPAQQTEEQQ